MTISRDGFRHNALYLLFIPGFVVAALSGRLLWAVIIGLPAVIDWAIIHTKIGTAKEEAAGPKTKKKIFQDVLYANCWEDPSLDREAFGIGPEDIVFSITSGGCNVLTFLLDDPGKVIALDLNPYQNYLLELKIAAFRELSHPELLEFFGIRKSSRRRPVYGRLRAFLSADAARYWDHRPRRIDRGLIHAGRYERYMRLLRKSLIAPLGKGRLAVRMFETEDPSEREKLYRERWEDLGWKILTRVMLSRRLNSVLFDKAFFAYLDDDFSFGRHFAAKAERALVRLPIQKNYFLAYILFGRFYGERCLPHYLRPENYDAIRKRLDRIEIVTDSCERYFASLPDSSVSKFNFSNIFEWMSPEAFENLLRETVRVARDKAVLTYRNLLVRREHPASLKANIRSRADVAASLRERDLSFIYNNFVVEEIRKEGP
jgi:S-adenosylmethionine-diacylglycerol 3-amino-3-carboxypropyl transferase